MVFHAGLGRCVVFGGKSGARLLSDTWEYDGTSWAAGDAAPPGLAARYQHGMAFDETRNLVVLFGGSDGGSPRNDTWEYGAGGWTAGPAAPPAMKPRRMAGITYDAARSRVVVFGGLGTPSVGDLYDMWEYDGVQWAPGATGPGPRQGACLTYDARRQRVLLIGGQFGPPYDGVWEYDGSSWTGRALPPPELELRTGTTFAYMASKGRSVVFGGRNPGGSRYFSDLWEYDGARWQRAGGGVTARLEHSFVSAGDGEIVLFGGYDRSPGRRDTWRFDGLRWWGAGEAPSALGRRYAHATAYDASRELVAIFGGYGDTAGDDTWLFDGSSWAPGPLAGPSARASAAMAYDPDRAVVVLFGGSTADTWELTVAGWSRQPPAPPG